MPDDTLGTVLITGGASGLGAAVAGAVADAGGTPVVLDLRPPPDGIAFRQVDLSPPARRRGRGARPSSRSTAASTRW